MFSIRQFRQDDADDVRRLFAEGQRQFSAGVERELEAYINDTLAGDLADVSRNYLQPGSNFWVAEACGRVIGMVGVQQKDPKSCELRRMAVDIKWRRKGLGRKLLDTAEDFAHQQGYASMILSTIKPLQPAIALYEGTGYRLSGQTEYGEVTVLHYGKDLLSVLNRPGGGRS
ncbi:MAG: GNAT family N-acetyltransferase [Chloroflexota bacterium]|nr:GNAT family N-acetyltransferase [Chloroflexota bacterium]